MKRNRVNNDLSALWESERKINNRYPKPSQALLEKGEAEAKKFFSSINLGDFKRLLQSEMNDAKSYVKKDIKKRISSTSSNKNSNKIIEKGKQLINKGKTFYNKGKSVYDNVKKAKNFYDTNKSKFSSVMNKFKKYLK